VTNGKSAKLTGRETSEMRTAVARHTVVATAVLAAALVTACSAAPSSSTSASTRSGTETVESASPVVAASPSATPTVAASPTPIASAIVGSWHRTIDCKDARAAFAKYGLLETASDWVCPAGSPPHPHSHFFTAEGQFGSRDPGGQQVDDGDYVLIAPDTLEFPSHEREFGYKPILVKFAVKGTAMFSVQVPKTCTDKCADGYGWALSAFATNPWDPGELPG